MTFPDYKQVIILGAGPAGLAVGRELACHGVDFAILEKGAVAGESFTRFPRNIFLGPWLNNTLPGSTVGWSWLLRRSTPSAYAYYLGEYARHNRLPLFTDVSVLSVKRESGGFVVETSRGNCACQLIINATGYFNKPYTPEYGGLSTTGVRHIHVSEYRSPETVRRLLGAEKGRVLIVGKRVSAGETMVELARAGYEVDLSCRPPLKFALSHLQEALFSPIAMVFEKIALKLNLKPNSYPPMAGGESQRLIASGRVRVRPDVLRLGQKEVTFIDGSSRGYDLVIFATGYRCAIDHLNPLLGESDGEPPLSNMESAEVPGLFFVGLEMQRTYRSRFLRGIRRDAPLVAELVAERLRTCGPRRSPTSLSTVVVPEEVLIDLDPTESPLVIDPSGRPF